jgi:plastocyanin
MDGSSFFIFGGALVAAALILSAIGIRGGGGSFPGSRPLLVGGTALFAAIVVTTAALAVVNAREEAEHREEEQAQEEASAEEGAAEEEAAAGEGAAGNQAGQGEEPAAESLDVTSPEDGSLAFEPNALESPAGPLTIVYSNPSPVGHNIAVEAADGTVLGETPTFTAGEEELTLEQLAPGQYVFFCTVPGHREGGMEGDLEVR